MKDLYRVAIIGTGRMGGLIEDELTVNQFSSPYGHFSAYAAIEQTEVVAVANRGEERSEAVHRSVWHYQHLSRLSRDD